VIAPSHAQATFIGVVALALALVQGGSRGWIQAAAGSALGLGKKLAVGRSQPSHIRWP